MTLTSGLVTWETARLVEVVAESPEAAVRCYPGWNLGDLARHVGTIHRWVAGMVGAAVTARVAWPEFGHLETSDLPQWLASGAAELEEVLANADPTTEMWTFSPSDPTCAFWRRRMALETTIHRWDAEVAVARDAVIDEGIARSGVDEALHVYLEPRLEGRFLCEVETRVQLLAPGANAWTVTLRGDGLEATDGAGRADAVITAPVADLWLLLMCRMPLTALDVAGDRDAAASLVRATALIPGPAR